jgi:MFS family permease
LNGQLGWSFFILGFACFIASGLAVKFGKRPVFLSANVILFTTSIWAFQANSWKSLLASQLIGSVGLGPFETLITAIIIDLYVQFLRASHFSYFVHQRGFRLALWGLAISIGSAASPIVSGYIIQSLGWRMTYKICIYFPEF